MNILILDSWLREFLTTTATPKDIAKHLSLSGPSVERLLTTDNDAVYDIEVTTNRVDLMSVIGIAREASAILPQFGFSAQFTGLPVQQISPQTGKGLQLSITDHDNTCSRIMAVILDNVKLGKSADIISSRLNHSGIRSLNNAVDITNYIMMELGQPTHVFDYDRIKSRRLILRKSKKGEKVTSLENKTYSLAGGDIVIDDGSGKIIDLPGIIGTANSVVNESTKRVIFFIDNPDPVQLRKTSMGLGIRTMAATINEKGVNSQLAQTALRRGVELFQKYTGCTIASEIYDLYPRPLTSKTVSISLNHLQAITGVPIEEQKCLEILNSLSFHASIKNGKITALVPPQRHNDINIPQDLIEEITRIYGYHNLPSLIPSGPLPDKPAQVSKQFTIENRIKTLLSGWGFTETYTYTMQSAAEITNSRLNKSNHLKITNPLSLEWVYMRTSLIPSLLPVIRKNQNLTSEMKLFELSVVYIPQKNNLPLEKMVLTAIKTGADSLLIIKGALEELLFQLGIRDYVFKNTCSEDPFWQKINTADLVLGTQTVGSLGLIDSIVLNKFGIENPVAAGVVDIEKILKFATLIKTYQPISQFTPITEDFSFSFAGSVQIGPIMEAIKTVDKKIKSVRVLDQYGKHLTFRVVFEDFNSQLSAAIVHPIRHKIVQRIKNDFAGTLIGKM